MAIPTIPREVIPAPVRALTHGAPHFFGYFDVSPWSRDGRWLLACRAAFQDRPPNVDDVLTLGRIDLDGDGGFEPFAETTAWCWQMGARLQWIGDDPHAHRVLFNERRADGRIGATVLDLDTGARRALDRPVYALHPAGTEAISVDFHRLARCRPGYGYAPASDLADAARHAPDDDGLWRVDLATGAATLICSLARARELVGDDRADGVPSYFNHVTYSPSGSRVCAFHLWDRPFHFYDSQMQWLTMDPDGSDVFVLNPHVASHYDWYDDATLLAWAFGPAPAHTDDPFAAWYSADGRLGGYYRFTDRDAGPGAVERVAEGVLPHDGHCTWSPDRRWVCTDEYAMLPGNEAGRPLILYEVATNRRVEVGRFAEPLEGELRCDLHPRWSADGTQLCIDSAHTGTRQVHLVDVSAIVS